MVHCYLKKIFLKDDVIHVFQFIYLFIIREKESYCEKELVVMMKYIKVHLIRQKKANGLTLCHKRYEN